MCSGGSFFFLFFISSLLSLPVFSLKVQKLFFTLDTNRTTVQFDPDWDHLLSWDQVFGQDRGPGLQTCGLCHFLIVDQIQFYFPHISCLMHSYDSICCVHLNDNMNLLMMKKNWSNWSKTQDRSILYVMHFFLWPGEAQTFSVNPQEALYELHVLHIWL